MLSHKPTIFYTFVDLMAELYLLTKSAGNRPSIATLNFSAAVECRRHGARPLDYFADLASAHVPTELCLLSYYYIIRDQQH